MNKVLKWLSSWWQWLVAAIAGLFALFLLTKHDDETPISDEAEDEREEIEEEIKQREQELQEARDKEQEEIERIRQEEVVDALEGIATDTEEVRGDPDRVNEYLIGVDEEMR
jgi:DNA anti-recombination protein RmuC